MFGSIRAAAAEAAMCSVQYLRDFIKERLTAACEEIFSEVQKTIVQYEEEISRQRRLLDISRKPDTHSHITDLPQQDDCEEEEGLDEQQVCNQERNSSLNQEDPEPSRIKEEQEELCSSQQGEQLGLKQEAEGIIIWSDEERLRLLETIWKPEIKLHRIDLQQQHVGEEEEVLTEEETNSSVDQENLDHPQIKKAREELCSSPKGVQLGLKREADTFMVTPVYEESDHCQPESNSEQLLSHSNPAAENRDQEESQYVDSRSTRNAEQKRRRLHRKRSHSQRVDNAPVSQSQSETDTRKKPIQCDTCGKTFHKKSSLTRHLSIHIGLKPYPCSTCEKRFNQKFNLERHVRTHTGEKPYACSACGKQFVQRTNLKTHMRIHKREKPYPRILVKSY